MKSSRSLRCSAVAVTAGVLVALAAGQARGGELTAALEGDGDLVTYFTGQATYLVARKSDGKILEEKPIAGNWGCVTGNVDAAYAWNGKAYLFIGGQYARVDPAKRSCDPGYPKPIVGNWPGVQWDRIDTAVAYNRKVYFFRGSNYIRYDLSSDRADPGYPKTVASGWNGLWGGDIEAALTVGSGKAVFIKGGEVADFNTVTDRAEGARRPLSSLLRRDPATCPPVTRGSPPPFQCNLRPAPPDPDAIECPDSTSIIDGKSRLPAPPDVTFKNYNAKKCKKTWPTDRPIMVQGDYEAKARVAGPKVNLIVIHETTAERGYVNDKRNLVHFLVDDDATVYQLMDLSLYAEHASHYPVSAKSIGIEVANRFVVGSCPSDRECVTHKPDFDKAPTKQWMIARAKQLDKLDKLVQHLIAQKGIPPTWLQLGYQNASGAPHFFIGVSNSGQVAPDAPASKPNDFLCPASRGTTGYIENNIGCGGVLSHSAVNDRDIDGAIPVLYTGLAQTLRRSGVAAKIEATGIDVPFIIYKVTKCILEQRIVNAKEPSLARHFNPLKQYKQGQFYTLDFVMLLPLISDSCLARSIRP